MKDFVSIARQYVADVLGGSIPAGRWIRLACERSRRDLERQADPAWPYRFDEKRANRICRFISTLRHVKDSIQTSANERIEIQPWQVWILTEVFGWVWKDSGKRRFRRFYIEVGRGNGKSTLSSGIVLYTALCEGVGGAEVLCAASSMDQSRIVLDTARAMLQKDPELATKLGAKVLADKITVPRSNTVLRGLPAKSTSVEGLSISCAVLDEVHAQRGRALHDTLSTGCAKREESLFGMITTAGDDSSGIAFELHDFFERLLKGEAEDESYFVALYGIDSDDDWAAPESWQKANPNWGISVDPKSISEEAKRAQQIPGQRATFQQKHLCVWISTAGGEAFLDPVAIRAAYNPALTDTEFEGTVCVYGCDLASTTDLCATARVHMQKEADGKNHYYVFTGAWLCEAGVKKSRISALVGWSEQGHLHITPGSLTRLDDVEEAIVADSQRFQIRDFSYDPMQSTMLVGHLQERGIDAAEIGSFPRYVSVGMNTLQELIADQTIHFNSPLLRWCLENLQMYRSQSGILYPRRHPKDRDLKIDAAVALVLALCSAYSAPLDAVSSNPYETRGIIFLDNKTPEQLRALGIETIGEENAGA